MPDILTVQDAIVRVMGDVREVGKNDRNTQQNFAFRGVDAVVNAVAPALRKHGLVVLPRLDDITYENVVVGQKQTHMIGCRVRVTYVFVGPGGDKLEATVAGEAMDAGDKATAKAMSVAFRIALLQALALPTDDVDPDAASYERAEPYTRKPETSPAVSPPAVLATQDAVSGSDSYGEGETRSEAAPVPLPIDGTDKRASDAQWENMLRVCDGSLQKAANKINAANKTTYKKTDVRERATWAELVAALV